MAPVEQGRQRAVPGVAPPGRDEDLQPPVDVLGEGEYVEVTHPRRCQLDRERHAVEATADAGDCSGVLGRQGELRLGRRSAFDEEPAGRGVENFRGGGALVRDGQRSQGQSLLAVDTEMLPARREDADVGTTR